MASGRRAVVIFAMLALAVVVAVAWLAPAALLDRHIAAASGGAVRLAEPDGTVWNGRGSLVGKATRIPIAWRVDGWPLLRGVVRVRWRRAPAPLTPRATFAAGADTLAFQDVDVTLPAAVFGAALSPFCVDSLAGEISLVAEDIEWKPNAGRAKRASSGTVPASPSPAAQHRWIWGMCEDG